MQTVQVELVGDDTAIWVSSADRIDVKSGSPCTAIARKLLGHYQPDARIEFYREVPGGHQLCLYGTLGKLARLITVDTARGLRLMSYKEFPGARIAHQGQD